MTRKSNGAVWVVRPEDWEAQATAVHGPGICHEMIGPSMGARLRSLYRLDLGQGSETVPLRHDGEAAYYVDSGVVHIEGGGESATLGEGAMVLVTPGSEYTITCVDNSLVIGGPAPVDATFGDPLPAEPPTSAAADSGLSLQFFHRDYPGMYVPLISADARFVIWYGGGASDVNMNYVVMEPGERNKEHFHRYSEDTVHILQGSGTAEDLTNNRRLPFSAGDTVFIPPGTVHAMAADRGERVVSVGGPCPADLDLLAAVGVDIDALAGKMAHRG